MCACVFVCVSLCMCVCHCACVCVTVRVCVCHCVCVCVSLCVCVCVCERERERVWLWTRVLMCVVFGTAKLFIGVAGNDVTANIKGGATRNNSKQLLQASSLFTCHKMSFKSHRPSPQWVTQWYHCSSPVDSLWLMRPTPLYCTPQHHNLHDDNISHKQNPANSSLVTLLYSCRCSEVCFILVTNDTQLVNRLDPLGWSFPACGGEGMEVFGHSTSSHDCVQTWGVEGLWTPGTTIFPHELTMRSDIGGI